MATRRHRLVIKPNIKPVAAKTAGSVTPKPKTPSINAGFESPSPNIRPHQVIPAQELQQPPDDDGDGRKQEVIPDVEVTKLVDLPGNAGSANETLMETELAADSKENESVIRSRQESFTPNKGSLCTGGLDDGGDGTTGMSSSAVAMNSTIPSSHQHKNKQLSATNSEILAVQSKGITNCAEVAKLADVDGQAATPSEADSSCMSEAMSLDADSERQKEVGDKSEKKRKSHKTKKPRAEPLPSREKSPDRQKLKMGDLLLWNPAQNFFPKKNKKKSAPKSETKCSSPSLSVTIDDDSESTNQSASLPAPQIMIGPDGNIVLNTESLLINTQTKDAKPREVLEDDDDDRYLNTNSYRKYHRTKQWTEKETEKFFMGLSMCGTDFSLLTNLMSNRTRRELKNKFYREERRNRELIDKALSNRQQYDLSPFEKMSVEDEKKVKVKKQATKRPKKEPSTDKKAEKTPQKRGRKKKNNKESEDEEDDWGQEYDEEDEENQNMDAVSVRSEDSPVATKKSKIKTETINHKKSKLSDQNTQETRAEQVPKFEDFVDLDNLRMTTKPTKTYSRASPEKRTMQQPTITAGAGPNFSSSSNVIQAIPGSTQVQIEMEGVQNPVQGVLIPSHMVPQIAPQLGIHGNPAGMQVLLVQEETASGSMVHVYVIPEGSTTPATAVQGSVGTSSHPAFTSPIPSPHPLAAVQSPGVASPFQTSNSHPLASVCSPPPKSPFQSPSPLPHPPSGDPFQRAYHQPHSSSLQQNPNPHSTPTRSHLEPPASHQDGTEGNLLPSLSTNNTPEKSYSMQSDRDDIVFVSPHSQSTGSLPPHNREISAKLPALEMPASTADGCTADVVVVAVRDTASTAGDGTVLHSTSIVDIKYSNDLEDDCIIVDPDRPESRFDGSAISCL